MGKGQGHVHIWICKESSPEALVLSHELAHPDSYDSYLVHALRPLRPLYSFGRSAAAFPPTKVRMAVMCWWQDPPRSHGDWTVSLPPRFVPSPRESRVSDAFLFAEGCTRAEGRRLPPTARLPRKQSAPNSPPALSRLTRSSPARLQTQVCAFPRTPPLGRVASMAPKVQTHHHGQAGAAPA